MGKLTGERRAVAAAVLAFYSFLFLVVSMAPPPGWGATFGALSAVYAMGFFGLVAGYFWARWFCVGLGMSGLISAGISLFQVGPEPALLFYGGTHGVISLLLWGREMSKAFDGQTEWRERFHMDENATHRLGKAVIRVGISLPYMVMYALAPRDGAGETLAMAAGLGLVSLGVWGLMRMRTWGALAIGAGAVTTLATVATSAVVIPLQGGYGLNVLALGLGGSLLALAAVAPLVGPLLRFVTGSDES